mgnify:CR=1 FL=1
MTSGKGHGAFLSPQFAVRLKVGEEFAPGAVYPRAGEKPGVSIVRWEEATAREWLAGGEGHPTTRALVAAVLAAKTV